VEIHTNELHAVLAVSDMQKAIAFYRDKLSFTIAWTYPDIESADQVGFKISSSAHRDQFQITLAEVVSPSGWLFVNVTGIEDIYKHYLENGVEMDQELDDFPWGYREFWVRDPDGNQIRFTQEINNTD
jgi:catechol 2,3-dioxygenase-like lactoylglutathione lyase family enzyme